MKNFIIIVSILLTSCISKSKPSVQDATTVSQEKNETYIIESGSDTNFDNFIPSFAFNSDLQMARIIFPLNYDSLGIKISIEKGKWRNDRLYADIESRTIISNEVKSDKNSTEQVFCWINTNTLLSKNYYFKKLNKKWYLVQIKIIREQTKNKNENFYSFLSNFCKDSSFQKLRVHFPITITSLNEDLKPVTVSCTQDMWKFTRFYFDSDSLIVKYNDFLCTFIDSDVRVLYTIGNGNGISATTKFQRIDNKWFMTKLNDQSN